ncbi:MAG: cytochrome c maturation protein CcmE [Selenomonadaceae bacterium]|nr:cytochrome c maturation protein CcmE [Selenomonadaceae bacterium]
MRKVFLAAMLAGFIVYAGMNLSESVTPYVSIAEATAATGSVQVKGLRDENFEPRQVDSEFIFNLRDEETGEILPVRFTGVKPDQFDEAYHIVAVGKYDAEEETFRAKKLLIKCPSKYEGQKPQ